MESTLSRRQKRTQLRSVSGLVFHIMRFSVRDGPGIRTTVFLKGCHLRCRWCHNPEGMTAEPVVVYRKDRCLACGACARICRREAVALVHGAVERIQGSCELCGNCVEACPTRALERIGTEMTAAQVMDEVRKDSAFYEESGGGVTISGGEPLCQPDFLSALLKTSKEEGIGTALDTSGAASFDLIERIRRDVDLFLYDLKLIDEARHRQEVGISNREILENLRRLADNGHKIAVRVPVVPGCNDDEANITAIGSFLAGLADRPAVELLAYHQAGEGKYLMLGDCGRAPSIKPPNRERIMEIADVLRTYDLDVVTGA